MDHDDYYTLKGYVNKEQHELSYAMEDYLEMICRSCASNEFVRVNDLSIRLNVTPPSASKMVTKLKNLGYVEFEPYGIIKPTLKGWEVGRYFLQRHDVINEFFQVVNHSVNELEITEKIEHFLDKRTILNMKNLIPEMMKPLEEKSTQVDNTVEDKEDT